MISYNNVLEIFVLNGVGGPSVVSGIVTLSVVCCYDPQCCLLLLPWVMSIILTFFGVRYCDPEWYS